MLGHKSRIRFHHHRSRFGGSGRGQSSDGSEQLERPGFGSWRRRDRDQRHTGRCHVPPTDQSRLAIQNRSSERRLSGLRQSPVSVPIYPAAISTVSNMYCHRACLRSSKFVTAKQSKALISYTVLEYFKCRSGL